MNITPDLTYFNSLQRRFRPSVRTIKHWMWSLFSMCDITARGSSKRLIWKGWWSSEGSELSLLDLFFRSSWGFYLLSQFKRVFLVELILLLNVGHVLQFMSCLLWQILLGYRKWNWLSLTSKHTQLPDNSLQCSPVSWILRFYTTKLQQQIYVLLEK